jgi:hypothetical protein
MTFCVFYNEKAVRRELFVRFACGADDTCRKMQV